MVAVLNEDIELMLEVNATLKDNRVEAMIHRWISERDKSRKYTRERIAERRKTDKNYGRSKKHD